MALTDPAFWRFLFLSFEGRISRAPYWAGSIMLMLVYSLISTLFEDLADGRLIPILTLPLYYPSVAVDVKRMHDRGLPLWLLIPFYLPAFLIDLFTMLGLKPVGNETSVLYSLVATAGLAALLWQIVELGIKRGVEGRNAHGPNPLDVSS